VEFLGLPGAGKSGVSRRVAELIQSQGIPVSETNYALTHRTGVLARRLRKSGYVTREVLLHPGYSARSARAIAATRQQSASDYSGALWNWLFVSNLLRGNGRGPRIHLLDEGIFQALWSIGFGASADNLEAATAGIAALSPTPDVVVVVHASPTTVERRLRNRGARQGRLDTDGLVLDRSERLLGEVRGILAGLAKSGRRVQIHDMANDREQDLEPNARALAGLLIPMFEGSR
jgi:thymidylate kinase